jgi:hypothetical protein
MLDSPYLKPCRLGDVIAAIQVLAYYKFYRLEIAEWAERITGDGANAGALEEVFRDHPEFFQISAGSNGLKAALVARRSFTRSYDVDVGRDVDKDTVMAVRDDAAARSRFSRRPLTPDETAVLIRTAVDMHSRAVEQRKAGHWWVPLAGAGIGFAGGIASTAFGFLIAS